GPPPDGRLHGLLGPPLPLPPSELLLESPGFPQGLFSFMRAAVPRCLCASSVIGPSIGMPGRQEQRIWAKSDRKRISGCRFTCARGATTCAVMTEPKPIPVSDDIMARLQAASDGRASAARLRDGILTMVLDVGGLDAVERARLER